MSGYKVSYSPWTNPYTGVVNTPGQNFYATSSTQQPVFRRLAVPAPLYRYPYAIASSEDEEEDEEDESGTI
jgi:hypothetical protein